MIWLYVALSIFGLGVTVVDLAGAFGHDSDHDGNDSDHDGNDSDHDGNGNDGGHDLSVPHDGGNAHDAGGHDGLFGHGTHGGDHDGDAHEGHDAHGDNAVLAHADHGSIVSTADKAARNVARVVTVMRTGVYFALGSGPIGLIASLRHEGLVESALWALISGFLTAVIARVTRRLVRRDIDSSFKFDDFMGQTAEVIVPINRGQMGKVRLRVAGTETELYARMESPDAAAAHGDLVTVAGGDDSCLVVVPGTAGMKPAPDAHSAIAVQDSPSTGGPAPDGARTNG